MRALIEKYKHLVVSLVNSLLIIIIINFLIGHFYSPKLQNPIKEKYKDIDLASFYPNLTADEIDQLLIETWSRPNIFNPVTLTQEGSFKGKFVNVSANGYRHTPPIDPWPIEEKNINIFLFGGSTTFGYGVEDNKTISYFIQNDLNKLSKNQNVHCYNFGSANFFSSQERARFESLILDKQVPKFAIFIDGLNEFLNPSGIPDISNAIKNTLENNSNNLGKSFAFYLQRQPLLTLLNNLIPSITSLKIDPAPDANLNSSADISGVINRYQTNVSLITAIARQFNIIPIFIWQPVPIYQYDLDQHPFKNGIDPNQLLSGKGYEEMSNIKGILQSKYNFVWLTEHPAELRGRAYVDSVHYSAQMNSYLADKISAIITDRYWPKVGAP